MRRRKSHSGELFTRDGHAMRDAELHIEILDNPEADQTIARHAIARAIENGLHPEMARKLYALKPQDR